MRSYGIVSILQVLMLSCVQGQDYDNYYDYKNYYYNDKNDSLTTSTLSNSGNLADTNDSLTPTQTRDYDDYDDIPGSSDTGNSTLSKVSDYYNYFDYLEKSMNTDSDSMLANFLNAGAQAYDAPVDCNNSFIVMAGPAGIMSIMQDSEANPGAAYQSFCRIFVTCFTNDTNVTEAVGLGTYPNLTMEDCNPIVVEDPKSLEDAEIQMRSVNASIFRMKITMQREYVDPAWGRELEYYEYISTLINHNFSAFMRKDHQARTGRALVQLAPQRIRVTGLSEGTWGTPLLNAPCYRKYVSPEQPRVNFAIFNWSPSTVKEFDICVCQKVEFNPSGKIIQDGATAEDYAVTQTVGNQSIGGKWVTLPVVHVSRNVCPGNSHIRGCCDSDTRAVIMYSIPDRNIDKWLAIALLGSLALSDGAFFPFDERIAFQQSESWQLDRAAKESDDFSDTDG